MLRVAAGVLAVIVAACGSSMPTPPTSAAGGTFASAHFVFNHTAADAAGIGEIAAAVEREHARVVTDLGVSAMPSVTVTFYTDHAAMEAATRAAAGVVPAWATGLITSPTQIHMMSPNAAGWQRSAARAATGIVHEFAHCVSMQLNPRIPNNPRWWWEAVAVYEAGESVDLRTLGYMTTLQPPSFDSLSGFDNGRVYEVGYSIAKFVVSRWGRSGLVDLLRASGDTGGALGMPLADFEREWFAFARQRYSF